MGLSKIQSTSRNLFKISDSITLDSGVTVPTIMGQVGQVDVVSQNGYRYKNGFWDRVLSDPALKEQFNNHDILGMTEHPKDDEAYLKTPYDQASHIILDAWCEQGNPYATIGLLNNDNGNNIKALVDVGHRPGVSTRGLGSFDKDAISQFIMDDNYLFITWDIVRSPNFVDLKLDKVTDSLRSSPIFEELVQMHQLKDSVDEHYSRLALQKSMDTAISALLELKNQLNFN